HRSGSLLQSCPAHVFAGYVLLLRGELEEAARLLRTGQEQLSMWGFGTGLRHYPSAFLAEIRLDCGDVDGARAFLEPERPALDAPDSVHSAWWYATLVRQLVEAGEHGLAVETADDCMARFAKMSTGPVTHPLRSLRAQALHHLGRAREAEESAAEE